MINTQVYPDAESVAQAAAQHIVELAAEAIKTQGWFSLGLSGGSTPRALYTLLASEPYTTQLPWEHIHVFWGDERCVPPDHAESNFRMARETLLDRVPLPAENIHRMRGELEPAAAAQDYEAELRQIFPEADLPRFDLLLQGMGDDGHTASLFPGTAALNENERWVVANFVPRLNTWRITLTAPAINAAAHVVFLVTGEGKANVLAEVLQGEYQPEHLPSQLIQPYAGDVLWMVDEAAASDI